MLRMIAIREAIRKSVWSEIKDGIKFIVAHKEMKFIIKSFFYLMAGVGSASCVIIVFIQEVFGSVTKDLSILFMVLGLGAFVGAMGYARFGQRIRKENVILACMLSSGIFTVIFAVTAKLTSCVWSSGAAMFLLGLSAGPIITSLNTMVHELIPQETRGRIFSSLEAVGHLAFLLFMLFASFLARFVERSSLLIASGVIFSICGFLGSVVEIRKRRIT